MITIGITCYREGDWLLECWESVLAQTDHRWTAVLVMDGTTHRRTQEVFEALSHPKLRKYAFSENLGPYPVRTRAFEMTETPYHFWLDGDDQLLPDAVATVLEIFERFPDADYVYGNYEVFGAYNTVWHFPNFFTVEDLASGSHPPGPCAYRKSLWVQLGGFSDSLADGMGDYDFFIGAHEMDAKGIYCDEIIYRYRVGHPGKVSQSYLHRYHEKCETIVKRHPHFFSNPCLHRRFMAMGYAQSAETCFRKGSYEEAKTFALQARLYGEMVVSRRILSNWRYRVPVWSIPFGNRLIRAWIRLRRSRSHTLSSQR